MFTWTNPATWLYQLMLMIQRTLFLKICFSDIFQYKYLLLNRKQKKKKCFFNYHIISDHYDISFVICEIVKLFKTEIISTVGFQQIVHFKMQWRNSHELVMTSLYDRFRWKKCKYKYIYCTSNKYDLEFITMVIDKQKLAR